MRSLARGSIIFAILTCSMASAMTAQGTPGPDEFKHVYELNEANIKWENYKKTSFGEQELELVELWKDAPREGLPAGRIYSGSTDFQMLLLERGLARLRPGTEAPQALKEAQATAAKRRLGMWAKDKESNDATRPTFMRRFWNFASEPAGLLSILGVVATIFVGFRFQRWRHRHKLRMIFLGEPSAGKTWLYSRLVERNISIKKLKTLNASTHRSRARTETLLMGPFEILPTFTDLPGSKPGQHLREILGGRVRDAVKRTIGRTRSIWVLTLSTTQDSSVSFTSTEAKRLQSSFISRQLGYLRLPQAVLADPDVANPALVILCVSKVDLFMKHKPEDSSSTDGLERLEREFSEHRALIKEECRRQGVPYEEIYVSALENWGIQDLHEAIRQNLYLKVKR